jgi:hypothetical protein
MLGLPDGERALTGGDTQNVVSHWQAMAEAEVNANAMSGGGAAQTVYQRVDMRRRAACLRVHLQRIFLDRPIPSHALHPPTSR